MAAPKLKPDHDEGSLEFVFKPIESRQHIPSFCSAIVAAFAQARAAKVESQTPASPTQTPAR